MSHRLAPLFLAAALTSPAAAQDCPSDLVFSYGSSSFASSFGSVLVRDGNTLVVGKPEHRRGLGLQSEGAAFVYERTDEDSPWIRTAVLSPESNRNEDFGQSIALSGPLLAVGAPRALNSQLQSSGLVYVYERGTAGFDLIHIVEPQSPLNGGEFGSSVALVGSTLYVGAPRVLSDGVSVFTVTSSAVTLRQTLAGADAGFSSSDGFGESLVASEQFLVVSGDPYNGAPIFAYRNILGSLLPLGPLPEGTSDNFRPPIALAGSIVAAGYEPLGFLVQARVWNLANINNAPELISLSAPSASAHVAIDEQNLVLRSVSFGGQDIVRLFPLDALSTVSSRSLEFCAGGTGSGVNPVVLDGPRILAGYPVGPFGQVFIAEADATGQLVEQEPLRYAPDVSKSLGAELTFSADFDSSLSGQLCWVLGSLSGTSPGVQLPAGLVPLNADNYTLAIIGNPATGPIPNSLGPLNAGGNLSIPLSIPAGVVQTQSGIVAHHSAIVLDIFSLDVIATSNAIPANIVD